MPVLTQVLSVPGPALAGELPPRSAFEASPGAPLLVRWVPAAGAGTPPFLAGTVLFSVQVTSQPAAGAGIPSFAQIGLGLVPAPARPIRAWQRDVQKYAITAERERHVQALWQYGELAVFALMWTTLDYAAGLAVRCPRCFIPAVQSVSPEAQIATAYGQGNQYLCPVCFDSQFVAAAPLSGTQPGLRALLVRPAIFTDMDKDHQRTSRGVMNPGALNAESTPDFRVRPGDFMFRVTGDRFRLQVPRRVTLRTGFASPYQETAAITYNMVVAQLEDPAAVSSIIPPDDATLVRWLGTYTRVPVSYAGLEIINGPLIPGEVPPPAASDNLQPGATFPLAVT